MSIADPPQGGHAIAAMVRATRGLVKGALATLHGMQDSHCITRVASSGGGPMPTPIESPSQSPSPGPSRDPSPTTGYPRLGFDDAVCAGHTTLVAPLVPPTRGRGGPPSVERNACPGGHGSLRSRIEASDPGCPGAGPGSVVAGGGGRDA